jgi:Putative peptidase (DUF1758)
MKPRERLNQAQILKLCCNCLSTQHSTKNCPSKYNCKICTKRHNPHLHLDDSNRSPTPATSGGSGGQEDVNKSNTTSISRFGFGKNVLLATAVVLVTNARGQPMFCRALLDSCSQPNIITEDCAQRLGLKQVPVRAAVLGLEAKPSEYKSSLTAKVSSRFTEYSTELDFIIMPKITGQQPDFSFETKSWEMPVKIQMADPEFNRPQKLISFSGLKYFMIS